MEYVIGLSLVGVIVVILASFQTAKSGMTFEEFQEYLHAMEEPPPAEDVLFEDFIAKKHIYLTSPKWRLKRKNFIKQAGFACNVCGATSKLEVHHLNYRCLENETNEDVVVLCRKHHQEQHDIHGYPEQSIQGYIEWDCERPETRNVYGIH